MHLLCVIDVFSFFVPHICHVGGVCNCLTLEKCILGYVDSGAFGRDDNKRRTWWNADYKIQYIISHIVRNGVTTQRWAQKTHFLLEKVALRMYWNKMLKFALLVAFVMVTSTQTLWHGQTFPN